MSAFEFEYVPFERPTLRHRPGRVVSSSTAGAALVHLLRPRMSLNGSGTPKTTASCFFVDSQLICLARLDPMSNNIPAFSLSLTRSTCNSLINHLIQYGPSDTVRGRALGNSVLSLTVGETLSPTGNLAMLVILCSGLNGPPPPPPPPANPPPPAPPPTPQAWLWDATTSADFIAGAALFLDHDSALIACNSLNESLANATLVVPAVRSKADFELLMDLLARFKTSPNAILTTHMWRATARLPVMDKIFSGSRNTSTPFIFIDTALRCLNDACTKTLKCISDSSNARTLALGSPQKELSVIISSRLIVLRKVLAGSKSCQDNILVRKAAVLANSTPHFLSVTAREQKLHSLLSDQSALFSSAHTSGLLKGTPALFSSLKSLATVVHPIGFFKAIPSDEELLNSVSNRIVQLKSICRSFIETSLNGLVLNVESSLNSPASNALMTASFQTSAALEVYSQAANIENTLRSLSMGGLSLASFQRPDAPYESEGARIKQLEKMLANCGSRGGDGNANGATGSTLVPFAAPPRN
ncbi:hypothetical protein T492DRAFT_841165 [Pavlovales sp. CCMP2436]|nr:hypothetical protein T492DRAFT_841165 [Pavlovales sp. CCMP2436]